MDLNDSHYTDNVNKRRVRLHLFKYINKSTNFEKLWKNYGKIYQTKKKIFSKCFAIRLHYRRLYEEAS